MAAKSTTAILQKLRALMKNPAFVSPPVHAYIIPSGDAHMSEYIDVCDARREFVSGFNGSAGTAIVTETKAAMWTDGRYFLQAEAQMDENWLLMKEGLPETPSQEDWLCKVLPVNGRVGIDPMLISHGVLEPMRKHLSSDGHLIVPVDKNLVDEIWKEQPPRPAKPVMVHPLKYSGKSWQDKVREVREKMGKKQAVALVVSALDDVAWLLNLRGSDILFNPVFFSFLIVTMDSILFFIDEKKLPKDAREHLSLDSDDGSKSDLKVVVRPYNAISSDLADLTNKLSTGKIWISDKSSEALFMTVPKDRRLNDPSPIPLMKSVKNEVEIEGMRSAHIKDAMALCNFFAWLEKEVEKRDITELDACHFTEKFRQEQKNYVSLSFETIASVGSNAAIIHYRPEPETNKTITKNDVFLLDSGAQFRDGTTDVTRTIHLGTPTEHEKECFTRVLKGHIALNQTVFPNGTKGLYIDALARQFLWQAGLDYMHGTGHGVGSFLNVHEGPCGIGTRVRKDDEALREGMVLSDEPGYYEDNKFGIRIENLVLVKKAPTKFNFKEKGFLTFEPLTLVPIQKKLITKSLLTVEEVAWINDYHRTCRTTIGAALEKKGQKDGLDWLKRETEEL